MDTSQGYIQFGSPPETLKDTKLLPNGVPFIFVLPYEHFNPKNHISMAEVEFPIYFNYFIRQQKTRVYINPDHIENMKIVLSEAAFGPQCVDVSSEIEKVNGYHIPNIKAEMDYFRRDMKLDDLVEFIPFPSNGVEIGEVKITPTSDKGFNVYDGGKLIAEIPNQIKFNIHLDLGATLREPFEPPEFGITCLGPSHGFDHNDNTSGFIFWINKTGIMVDPPVNSTEWLRDSNVNPKLIDCIILTHCHADHDSGTFQKILEEGRINLYTTPTVMQSFLRKYSALTRIPTSELVEMFNFHPIKINVGYNIHGAIFNFYYSLHSIPTIAFHFTYRNKSLLYSSDHLNNPAVIEKMYDDGVISNERKVFLLDFPWDCDLIYHEAGVPPLHTSIDFLNSLDKDIQKKVTVYHIAKKDFPKDTSLTLAKFGIGETVYPKIEKHKFEDAYRILDVFSRIEIFKDLPPEKMKDLLLVVEEEHFSKGDKIIEKNTPGDKFYVIVSGNVSIGGIENVSDKVYGTFEYFGEASLLLGGLRSADVIAETSVTAYSIAKGSFLRLIRHTKVEHNIRRIAHIRNGESWNIIKSNKYLSTLSSSQITYLESVLTPMSVKNDKPLMTSAKIPDDTYIMLSGKIHRYENGKIIKTYKKGEFINNPFLEENINAKTDFEIKSSEDSEVYVIKYDDFKGFLGQNPGLKMLMMYEKRTNGH